MIIQYQGLLKILLFCVCLKAEFLDIKDIWMSQVAATIVSEYFYGRYPGGYLPQDSNSNFIWNLLQALFRHLHPF